MTNCIRVCLALCCASLSAQEHHPSPTPAPEPVKEALGRTSPRGTVLGFLAAARKGNMEVASQYLNTTLRGDEAHVLAQQLFTVLDRRLPAKLFELSDSPEGSLATYKPDEDLVGTISSAQGAVSILVERVPGGRTGHIWLFSSETLKKIPDLFNELDQIRIDRLLPKYLSDRRIAGVALFNYLGVFLVMPALYLVLSLLNRILGLLVARAGTLSVVRSCPRRFVCYSSSSSSTRCSRASPFPWEHGNSGPLSRRLSRFWHSSG